MQLGDPIAILISTQRLLRSCNGDCQWAPYVTSVIFIVDEDLIVANVEGQSVYLNHQDDVWRVEVWIDFDPTGGTIDRLHYEEYYEDSDRYTKADEDVYYTFSGLSLVEQTADGKRTFALLGGEAVGHATGSADSHCTSAREGENNCACAVYSDEYFEWRPTCDLLYEYEATSETEIRVTLEPAPWMPLQ